MGVVRGGVNSKKDFKGEGRCAEKQDVIDDRCGWKRVY